MGTLEWIMNNVLFIADWVFRIVKNKGDAKKQNKQYIEQTIRDIDYNCTPGVGSLANNFRVEAHENLLNNADISTALKDEIKEIIFAARLCNGNDGRLALAVPPGAVKERSKMLRPNLVELLK